VPGAPFSPPPPPPQSGNYEPGYGTGYGGYGGYGGGYGDYYGATYPSQAEMALYRMNPSDGVLKNRAIMARNRYQSNYPYDV
jgi:hypothetical protein